MPVLLDVFGSPRLERSRTRKLRDAFVDAWTLRHPDGQVITVNPKLEEGLPEFDEWDVEAKLQVMHGAGQLTEDVSKRWDLLSRFTDQLHMADVVLVSCPMWNLSIPWPLKRWIDVVVQPRLTFEIRDGGFHGLLGGRTGVLLITRDSAFGPGTEHAGMDFQVPYLKAILGLLGLEPIHSVVAEPLGAEGGARILERARVEAAELARRL